MKNKISTRGRKRIREFNKCIIGNRFLKDRIIDLEERNYKLDEELLWAKFWKNNYKSDSEKYRNLIKETDKLKEEIVRLSQIVYSFNTTPIDKPEISKELFSYYVHLCSLQYENKQLRDYIHLLEHQLKQSGEDKK